MPHRNVVRQFASESVYHVYNRGVEKRLIFMDSQDYNVFTQRLEMMLTDPEELRKKYTGRELIHNYRGKVELLAYCLMPNHFHLLLYQHEERDIAEFMRTLSNSYTAYFNLRYKRVGSLFQGTYKARLIQSESDWQHISRYIHLNPESLGRDVFNYSYSSLPLYSNSRHAWLAPLKVIETFGSYENYANFLKESRGAFDTLDSLYTLE